MKGQVDMMGYGYGYNMMGGWFGMMIIPTILIAMVVYVIYNQLQNSNVKDTRVGDNPLDILNKRFASGEIDEEEYYNKKNVLSKDIY